MDLKVNCRLALLSLVALLPGRALTAQGQYKNGTPEAAAATALRADSLHDWQLLLAMAHPEALEHHKRDQLEMFRPRDMSEFPPADPCMIKAVENWRRMLLDSVYQVPTVDSLRNLAPDTLFARDQRFFGHWAKLRASEDTFAPTRRILGHVLADDSTAYVILELRYHTVRLPEFPSREPAIMTLRWYHGTWRTMLDPDLGDGIGGLSVSPEDCR